MTGQRQGALRLEQNSIPALRVAFSSAVDQLDEVLVSLRQKAHLPGPWLGDETSSAVAAHYTRRAMTDPDSSYRSLEQYRNELLRIHDALQQMEGAYRHGESDEAARWGPRT